MHTIANSVSVDSFQFRNHRIICLRLNSFFILQQLQRAFHFAYVNRNKKQYKNASNNQLKQRSSDNNQSKWQTRKCSTSCTSVSLFRIEFEFLNIWIACETCRRKVWSVKITINIWVICIYYYSLLFMLYFMCIIVLDANRRQLSHYEIVFVA